MNWLPYHPDWHIDVGVLLLALALDFALPEPPNSIHPVVWMGKAISALERLGAGRGDKAALVIGAGIAVVVPVAFGGLVWLALIGLRELGELPYLIGGAALLKTTFAVRGLGRAAKDTQRGIEDDDLSLARHNLRSLVSRDAAALPKPMVAAAAIESVAENTTDSFIAPWLAFALLGLPGRVRLPRAEHAGQHDRVSWAVRIPRQGVGSAGRLVQSAAGAHLRGIAAHSGRGVGARRAGRLARRNS